MTPAKTLIDRFVFAVALAVAAALVPAPVASQAPPCANALRGGEVDTWADAELIAADLTLDGATDAAYWRVAGSRVEVLIGTCDGGTVDQRWRLAVDPGACSVADLEVEAASLLLDEALVERTCAGEQSSSECAHLRRENERRQARMDAGGRELRIGGPSCTAATLRWRPDMGGFMRIPG